MAKDCAIRPSHYHLSSCGRWPKPLTGTRPGDYCMKELSRFCLLLVAILTSIVPSHPVAQGGRSGELVVTHDGFGPVKVGMTLPQASKALGVRVTRGAGYEDDGCYYASPEGAHKGVAFMMSGPRIVRIDVRSSRYATDRGARVGDSEARIKRLYKGEYKVSRHKYFEEGRYIEVEAGAGRYLLLFETDGKRVTTYRVGRPEQVGYVEGCS